MNWFKNLNAKPRLMSSFGVLLVLTLGISYLAISSLSKANDRIQSLYQKDLRGVIAVELIDTSRIDLAQKDRDALIKIDDQASVATDINAVRADFGRMRTGIQDAEQSFLTKEGKDIIADMRENLPAYEKSVEAVITAIEAKDTPGAKIAIYALAPLAAHMSADIDHALKLKESHAEDRFQENLAAYDTARSLVIGAAALSLALGLILSFVIARGFSVPLGQAVATLEKVAGGDLTASLDVGTHDEVGRMAEALNSAVERLHSTMQQVTESAANTSDSSQQLAAASDAIASGAQEQAASLEETSASLEQITAAVRMTAENAKKASDLASGSHSVADRGQDGVSAMAAMAEISASSAKISEIISSVDEIAFQTNLLAVVASEVRILAQRSAASAKEIKGLIQDSLKKVERGSDLVKQVTLLVSEIALSSGEQSAGIEQVNTAMSQMDQVTQSNSAQTEELSATAESLAEQASHLSELVSTFTLSHNGNGRRDQQAQQPHEATAAHHSSQAQRSSSASRSLLTATRSNSAARPELKARGSKRINARQATPAIASPSVPAIDDASFEEF
jgi:methyl-accepting chemotaxis protein